jgi:hypothetical protein
VTVALTGVPGQLLAVGVIVNVTVTGALVVFVKVPLMLPIPLAAIPVTVAVLSLVQLNTVPPTLPLNTIVVIGEAEQTVCEAGFATASGVGFTVPVAATFWETAPVDELTTSPEGVPAVAPVSLTNMVVVFTVPITGVRFTLPL